MRIAILADIHGNLPALQTVAECVARERPDLVLVAGDIVNRGPGSPECLAFVQQRAAQDQWRLIRGNHERYVITAATESAAYSGLEAEIQRNVHWTLERLGSADALLGLPTRADIATAGGDVRLVHASMLGDQDNILITTTDAELRAKIAPPPQLFCCGHTHRPLVRMCDETLVINAGSVGLPFDGDPRASYALAEFDPASGWTASIKRIAYDRDETARSFETSGFFDQAGPIARIIFEEFLRARPFISEWLHAFETPVLDGVLTPDESVARFVASLP